MENEIFETNNNKVEVEGIIVWCKTEYSVSLVIHLIIDRVLVTVNR